MQEGLSVCLICLAVSRPDETFSEKNEKFSRLIFFRNLSDRKRNQQEYKSYINNLCNIFPLQPFQIVTKLRKVRSGIRKKILFSSVSCKLQLSFTLPDQFFCTFIVSNSGLFVGKIRRSTYFESIWNCEMFGRVAAARRDWWLRGLPAWLCHSLLVGCKFCTLIPTDHFAIREAIDDFLCSSKVSIDGTWASESVKC